MATMRHKEKEDNNEARFYQVAAGSPAMRVADCGYNAEKIIG
jgi:hypothetical protein